MKIYIYTILLLTIIIQSCDRYLNIKPRSNLVVPETLDDMRQLLDNGTISSPYPELLELQADDFYFEDAYWNSMVDQVSKNAYVWGSDIYGSTDSHAAWSQPYSKIFYANAVLDALGNIQRTDKNASDYDHIKGSALFLKAEAVYILAQLFAKVYDERTSNEDLGIPVPMSSDVNEPVYRPSLQYTFDFITSTLLEAEKLLSPVVDFSRPSKAAAHALLARIYLYMGAYEQALLHSDRSLEFFNDLVDLNTASTRDYKSTLLLRIITPANEIRNLNTTTLIDTSLIGQYEEADKRRTIFFVKDTRGKWMKQRLHNLVNLCFAGLDADEQYLIRAECYARDGKTKQALDDLNHLLANRFTEGEFSPYESSDKDEVLEWVLIERRKELVFRGLRWSDLKRMNREGRGITLVRKLEDRLVSLSPDDNRWMLPIPRNEVNLSEIKQNER